MTKEDIIARLRLDGVDKQKQDDILASIITTVEYRFAGVVDDMLDEQQASQFGEVVETGDADKVITWLRQNVPKAAELYTSILEDYLTELSEQVGQASA